MTGIEQLKCENCGAPLTPNGKCEYCGAVYRAEWKHARMVCVEVEHPGAHTLQTTVEIGTEVYLNLPEEAVAHQITHSMTTQFAAQLASFIRFDKTYDPRQDKTIIRGRLRVLDPSFRF